jgi:glutaredoxin
MIVKIFTKKDCPRCPAAKKLIEEFREKKPEVKVEDYDVETVDGMAEAAFYTIMATPSILMCDDKGKEIKGWRGEVPGIKDLLKI